MTTVVNKYGRIIDGPARDAVIEAAEKGRKSVESDGVAGEIVEVTRDPAGNRIIKVEVLTR